MAEVGTSEAALLVKLRETMPRFFRDPGEDSEASEIPAGIHGVPDTSAIDPVPADAEEYITIAGGGDGEETAEPSSSFALARERSRSSSWRVRTPPSGPTSR